MASSCLQIISLAVLVRVVGNDAPSKNCYFNGDHISIIFNMSQDAARMRLIWGTSVVDYSIHDTLNSIVRTSCGQCGNFTVELLSNSPLEARVNATFIPPMNGSTIVCLESNAITLEPNDVYRTVPLGICESEYRTSCRTHTSCIYVRE